MAEAIKLNPKLSVAGFSGGYPSFINSPPGFRDNLKKAGLPEVMSALDALVSRP